MIQFNLLPDVKIEFIKSRRIKRLVTLLSVTLSSVALIVMIGLFIFVNGAQKKHIKDINRDIKINSAQLKGTKDLDKILTIQNQLNSLTSMHDQKPVATRLFDYITSVTPAQASISSFNIDFTLHTISISGAADDLSVINQYVDTLKFTTYRVADQTTDVKAFSSTVLTSFDHTDKNTTYHIDTVFDPLIFDSKTKLSLTVPKKITTRSETEKPTALFQQTESDKANP